MNKLTLHYRELNVTLRIPKSEKNKTLAQLTKVGFAMISFGIANAFGSILFGQIIKYINRIYLYLLAAFINYLAIYLMLEWKINDHNEIYLILFMWGLADSIWQTQVNSLYGVLFNQFSSLLY